MTTNASNHRALAIWLLVICALIFTMVVLGGVTRLTRSGLSMVEWAPVMGVVPPLTDEAWNTTFEKYKQFPEYQKINKGMSLDEFKSIFWFEYSHRLLGRTIGLAFLLPFIVFLIRKQIPKELNLKLVIMFVLGGMQGLLGWYMVKSGLVDKPHVSQYRLTAHLLMALLIYGYILWVALGLLSDKPRNAEGMEPLRKFAIGVTVLVVLMITTGGFVAGTKAGFSFNTFPLMFGRFVPEGMFAMEPIYINFVENVATIQFTHRILAYVLIAAVAGFWLYARRFALDPSSRLAVHLLLAMLAIQVTLGIVTLLLVVPVPLAAAHQGGAMLLFTIALVMNHRLRISKPTKVM